MGFFRTLQHPAEGCCVQVLGMGFLQRSEVREHMTWEGEAAVGGAVAVVAGAGAGGVELLCDPAPAS